MTGAAWAVITTVTALGWALHRVALARLTRDPLDDEYRRLTTETGAPPMTDRPYTDDDLRAEAARQLSALIENPDFMGVGEQMANAEIESQLPPTEADGAEGPHWGDLLDGEQFGEAQQKIHDLITGAADVSDWAVNLGAEGLEPEGHTIRLGAKGPDPDDADEPLVKLHFAFHPTATAAERDRFVVDLSKVITRNL